MTRHEVTGAGRRPSRGRLDIVRETVIAVGGLEPGHDQQVLGDMVRQLAGAQLLVSPGLEGYIDISDGATEGVGILRGQGAQVL
jgi:hypothetical protein